MTKEDIRRGFPVCIAFADEVRDVFGDGVKLLYMKEGDKEMGTPHTPHPSNEAPAQTPEPFECTTPATHPYKRYR